MTKNLRSLVPAFAAAALLAAVVRGQEAPTAEPPQDLSAIKGSLVQTVKSNKMLGVLRIEPGRDLRPEFSDPKRVATILKLIEDVYYGRPLQFPKDGTTFANKEGRLPAMPLGHYKEYTVLPPPDSPTRISVGDQSFTISPAGHTRGAERVIIGGGQVAYYTPDHYRTFIELTIVR